MVLKKAWVRLMDKILIRDIRAYGYIGFFEAEKQLGQWFSVDLILETDLRDAAAKDDLTCTIDYGSVVQQTRELIQTLKVDLIETVAEAIANSVLSMERVKAVEVTLTKDAAPIPDFGGSVAVSIYRSEPLKT